jgi:hypothetical protein
MTHPTVERADNRYQIRVDSEPAGFTEFRDLDAQRVFIHTEITEYALTRTRDRADRQRRDTVTASMTMSASTSGAAQNAPWSCPGSTRSVAGGSRSTSACAPS